MVFRNKCKNLLKKTSISEVSLKNNGIFLFVQHKKTFSLRLKEGYNNHGEVYMKR